MLESPTFLQARARAERFFGQESPGTDALAVALVDQTHRLYHGDVPGIQPCDTAFHDFDHAMQSALATLDLCEAHRQRRVVGALDARDYLLAFAAVLFHDTGYLKRVGDSTGSGAKYTAVHVGRSCFRAWDLLPALGFTPDELRQVQNAISATAVGARMDDLPFRNSREWVIAALVATGDMLGQVAAEDYPERLPGLYLEFREASAYSRFENGGFAAYRSLRDLLAGTETFFSQHVGCRLELEWRGLHRLLGNGPLDNPYIGRMRRNVSRVKAMVALLGQDGNSSQGRRPRSD